MAISNSNGSTKESVQTEFPKNRNNVKNRNKNDCNKNNDTNQDPTELADKPTTPIVYESIDIEEPVVQMVAKRDTRRSRRTNKQKQNAERRSTNRRMQIKHKIRNDSSTGQ